MSPRRLRADVHGVDLRERAAYVRPADALVVADTHVGRDEASAVDFPLGERSDLTERLAALLAHFSPERVVVAGDVLHSFRGATADARRGLDDLLATCREAGAAVDIVAGNHDVHLPEAGDREARDAVRLGPDGETVVCHGHELPAPDGPDPDRYVCGHVHPTITVEGHRRPCYLEGPGPGDATVLVLPAFNRLAPGVDVGGLDAAGVDSPLVPDLGAFRPLVYDPDSQEVLAFPPLAEFRELL